MNRIHKRFLELRKVLPTLIKITENQLPKNTTTYLDFVNPGWLPKIETLRDSLYKRALRKGDSLFPWDIVEMMKSSDRAGRYKNYLGKGVIGVDGQFRLVIYVFESCGFEMLDEEKEFTRENIEWFGL